MSSRPAQVLLGRRMTWRLLMSILILGVLAFRLPCRFRRLQGFVSRLRMIPRRRGSGSVSAIGWTVDSFL